MVAKAFDLIHKINNNESDESRIPFDDQEKKPDEEPPKPKRPKVEIAFFYVLLFIIFFIMGARFVSPDLFGGVVGNSASASPSASPITSPAAGFVIDKQGQSVDEARQDLKIPTPIPSVAASVAASEPTKAPESSAPQAAKIQVLNGTSRTGAAATMRTKLANAGIAVSSIGNYKSRTVKTTTVFYHPDYKKAATDVHAVTGGILSETTTGIGSYNILVVIGQN